MQECNFYATNLFGLTFYPDGEHFSLDTGFYYQNRFLLLLLSLLFALHIAITTLYLIERIVDRKGYVFIYYLIISFNYLYSNSNYCLYFLSLTVFVLECYFIFLLSHAFLQENIFIVYLFTIVGSCSHCMCAHAVYYLDNDTHNYHSYVFYIIRCPFFIMIMNFIQNQFLKLIVALNSWYSRKHNTLSD